MAFRSILRAPAPHEVRGRMSRVATRSLSRLLYRPYPWSAALPLSREIWENPTIPAGYTYLAQLVAHDLVQSSTALSRPDDAGADPENLRHRKLRLDTLYGAGFDGCMHALSGIGQRDAYGPSKIPLSDIVFVNAPARVCPSRDLQRLRAHDGSVAESGIYVPGVPDNRNDNNALVSQMIVLFSNLHNCVVDLLGPHFVRGNAATPAKYERLYNAARDVCVEVYRRIVIEDVLPRLLQAKVLDWFRAGGCLSGSTGHSSEISREFLEVFRFGHAMVRPHYKINDYYQRKEQLSDVLMTTSKGRPWRFPLDETWAVQWSHFFSLSERRPNFSRRIGPSLSPGLMSDIAFDAVDDIGEAGLGYRDLASCSAGTIWSTGALVDEIQRAAPDLLPEAALCRDGQGRRQAMVDWLTSVDGPQALCECERLAIADDPPLLLFTLVEAARETDGQRLGALGSIIVADTVSGVLNGLSVAGGCGAALVETLGKAVSEEIDGVACMSDLVRFVDRHSSVGRAPIPLV